MKKKLIIWLSFILIAGRISAQDTLSNSVQHENWELRSAGASYTGGRVLYFGGMNHQILSSDTRSGFPIYSDWNQYQPFSIHPFSDFWQGTIHATWHGKRRNIYLSPFLTFSEKKDTIFYVASLGETDTTLARMGTQKSYWVGLGLKAVKSTKPIFGFLRGYAGAEIELQFSSSSKIDFYNYSYDSNTKNIGYYQEYNLRGRTCFNGYLTPLLGIEVECMRLFEIFAEVKTGVGFHLVPNSGTKGISRTLFSAGLNYYIPKKKITI